MNPLLTVEGVVKSFAGIRALDGVSLDVLPGEVHAVVGENGAGKSTLMNILAGGLAADSGEVRFHGRAISMIHQELLPFPNLTVGENIWMGAEPVRRFPGLLDKPAMRRGAREWLARVGLDIAPDRPMRELTVAEAQSVEIARAIARDADLFVMDEPTSALSAREAEALFSLVAGLRARGAAVIYISHHLDEIFRLADRITVLRDGRRVATEPASTLDTERLIALMVGRELDQAPARASVRRGEPALEVRGLARRGRFRDVTFTLHRGEVLGLAGLMGAGRTDVAAAVFGLAPADAGEILVHGRAVRIQSPADAIAHGIAMVTEDRKEYGVVPGMSVRHNLTLSALSRCSRGPVVLRGEEAALAAEQVRRFAIRAAGLDAEVRWLSGGNQQKVVLAKALLAEPSILLLDEPTRGIDVGAKAEIHALIARLAAEGKAVLLVSSEMNEVLRLSDRILVMREGAVAGELDPRRTAPEEVLRLAMPA